MKIQMKDEYCAGCVWILPGNLCPFPYPTCMKNVGLFAKKEVNADAKND